MLIEYINPSYLLRADDNQRQVWIINIGRGGLIIVAVLTYLCIYGRSWISGVDGGMSGACNEGLR